MALPYLFVSLPLVLCLSGFAPSLVFRSFSVFPVLLICYSIFSSFVTLYLSLFLLVSISLLPPLSFPSYSQPAASQSQSVPAFHGMEKRLFRKALTVLQRQGKAELIIVEDEEDDMSDSVKFFS